MPLLSDSMEQGTILTWLIENGEPAATTAAIDVDLPDAGPAPARSRLARRLAQRRRGGIRPGRGGIETAFAVAASMSKRARRLSSNASTMRCDGPSLVSDRHFALTDGGSLHQTGGVSTSSRRGFLRALGLGAAREARAAAEVAVPLMNAASPAGVVRAALSTATVGEPHGPVESAQVAASLEQPPPPSRCATVAEVRALADEEGLSSRWDDIEPLVQRSVRLLPGAASAPPRAWVDFAAAQTIVSEPPAGSAVTLAQFDRSAAEFVETPLGGSGWSIVFAECLADGVVTIQVTALPSPAALTTTMEPVGLGEHLVLPRVWTQHVQDLGLCDDEHDAFVRLRDRLAAEQRLAAEPAGGSGKAYHRLFGYPDETSGAMPGRCVELSGAGDWRLLIQISAASQQRVYGWVAGTELDRVVGFVS